MVCLLSVGVDVHILWWMVSVRRTVSSQRGGGGGGREGRGMLGEGEWEALVLNECAKEPEGEPSKQLYH